MNFEDEPYVRIYKRKTLTFKRLGWEGRTVLWHLMLEADRAGIIELGEDNVVEAVAALCDLPEDVVSRGLSKLASHSVTERHGTSLVITRFIEAQEATRSDKARARDYRERRRANIVTQRDDESHSVTERHESSQAVTDRHSEQSRTEQNIEVSPPRASRRSDPVVTLPVDFEVPESALKAKAERYEVDIATLRATTRDFVWYWTEGKGAGKRRTMRGWVTAWCNNVDRLAKQDSLVTKRAAARTQEAIQW